MTHPEHCNRCNRDLAPEKPPRMTRERLADLYDLGGPVLRPELAECVTEIDALMDEKGVLERKLARSADRITQCQNDLYAAQQQQRVEMTESRNIHLDNTKAAELACKRLREQNATLSEALAKAKSADDLDKAQISLARSESEVSSQRARACELKSKLDSASEEIARLRGTIRDLCK